MLALWHDEPWQVLVAMPVLGTGVGFAFAAMATLITEAVRPSETGIATGMNTVMRTVGGYEVAFAIAAIAAFVGVVVAVLVTPRRERLVVAAEASD